LEFHIFAVWTPVNQAIKTFRREQSSNQGKYLSIKSLDPGHKHFYRWHVCNYFLLFNYVYAHTPAPKLLSSYPPFKRAVSWLYKTQLNRIHGASVKAELLNHPDQQKSKPKLKNGQLQQFQLNTLPVSDDICYFLQYRVSEYCAASILTHCTVLVSRQPQKHSAWLPVR